MEDTIAAISTPPGHGGIGIVRLTGSNAVKIADRIFLSPKKKKLKNTPTHRILFGHAINPKNKEVIDEVLVSVMKAPNTYTREDIVEINCHGGAVPLRRILELLLKGGARLAEPGEFTQRAFLNGRMDLAQAEAVLDMVNALTVQSQKTAIKQLSGSLSGKIEAIREKIIELTAFVEAYIDFPEEDIEPLTLRDMKKMAAKIQRSLTKLIDSARYGLILREGLKTAIVGRPNVGKSSLLNALLDEERAIVTDMPGTTRDVIEDYLNIDGIPVKIMDTAGIRTARNIAEKEGVRRSLKSMKEADLVILVLDGSEPLHSTDNELIAKSGSQNTIVVINKSDLKQKVVLKKGQEKSPVKLSAKKGTGLNRLKKRIAEAAMGGHAVYGSDIVTNTRHVDALERALSAINSFTAEVTKKTSPEFLSVELRDALDAIGEILGITTPEDILNKIFSSFCIGK